MLELGAEMVVTNSTYKPMRVVAEPFLARLIIWSHTRRASKYTCRSVSGFHHLILRR